jgi:hypothetical protein
MDRRELNRRWAKGIGRTVIQSHPRLLQFSILSAASVRIPGSHQYAQAIARLRSYTCHSL